MEEVINKSADNPQLVKYISQQIPLAVEQCASIADQFRAGGDEKEECRLVWTFLNKNVKYKEDSMAKQRIVLPKALIRERQKGADCKSFSLFAYGVLKNLGHKPFLKFVSYDKSPYPSHVYVQTESGYIVDATIPQFNYEVPYKTHMEVSRAIAGPNLPADYGVYGLKDLFKKVTHTAKAAGLAAPRNAFLLITKVNGLGLASKLARAYAKNRQKVDDMWYKFGGAPSALRSAVDAGKGKKPILSKEQRISGAGIGEATLAATLAAAAPIVAAVTALVKSLGVADAPGETPSASIEVDRNASTFAAEVLQTPDEPEDKPAGGAMLSNPIVLGGIALIAAKALKLF